MIDREQFGWKVEIADAQTGKTETREVHSFWDPARIDTPERVAEAAVAEAFIETRRKHIAVGTPERL